jgi:hypothetical protein
MDGIHDLGGMQGFGPVAHALADGELAFDTPWQGRVFALAAAVVEHAFGGDREPFRRELVKAIATEPGRPYWENWAAALEALAETLPEPPGT